MEVKCCKCGKKKGAEDKYYDLCRICGIEHDLENLRNNNAEKLKRLNTVEQALKGE